MDAIKVGGLWITSDGQAVLSDANYWDDVLNETHECAILKGVEKSYKMDTKTCTRTKPFICEKTN